MIRSPGIAFKGLLVVPQLPDLHVGFVGSYGDDSAELSTGDVVSIVDSSTLCKAASYSPGLIAGTVGIILDASNMGVFDFQRKVPSTYRICVCPKGVWKGETSCEASANAGDLTVQSALTQLVVNGVASSLVTLPQGWCEDGGTSCEAPRMELFYVRPDAGTVCSLILDP